MKYRAEIDGLRAIAVLSVIFFHANFEFFSGGFVGVDVFFVISGYLITNIILTQLEAETFSLADFYERRARRILPALFFMMLVCLPFAWFWLFPNMLQEFGESIIGVVTFSSNILFWQQGGYFDGAAELKPMLHTWTLSVEEQFYIFFPLFLLCVWRFGKKPIVVLLVAFFIISLALAQWGAYNKPSATFYLLPTRMWELLLGSFSALYLQRYSCLKSYALNQFISLFGLALIIGAVVFYDHDTPFPSLFALVPTLGTVFLIICATNKTWVKTLLSAKPFVAIGLISYGLYLWHQPVFVFSRLSITGEMTANVIAFSIGLSLFLSMISYHWIEKPCRNKLFNQRQVFCASISAIVFFIVAGLLLSSSSGYSKKNANIQRGDIGHDAFHSYLLDNYSPCQDHALSARAEVWNGVVRCQQTDIQSNHQIALFGDSHAEHHFLGLANNSVKEAIYLIRGGNPFKGEVEFDYLIDHIVESDSLTHVVYGGYWAHIVLTIGIEDFEKRFINTVKTFIDANKKVTLVVDVPNFDVLPESCLYRNILSVSNCSVSYQKYRNQTKTYLHIFEKLAEHELVELVDVSDEFCDKTRCSMVNDDSIIYRDKHHLNIVGSNLIGKEILIRSTLLK